MARIIVDAVEMGEKYAAEYWGVCDRTVRRYRQIVPTDPELAALVDEKRRTHSQEAEAEWRKTRVRFLCRAVGTLERLLENADAKQIRTIAGAIKIVGELHTTQQALAEDDVSDERHASLGQDPHAPPAPRGEEASESAAPVH